MLKVHISAQDSFSWLQAWDIFFLLKFIFPEWKIISTVATEN